MSAGLFGSQSVVCPTCGAGIARRCIPSDATMLAYGRGDACHPERLRLWASQRADDKIKSIKPEDYPNKADE
jgi:hypothetical protein